MVKNRANEKRDCSLQRRNSMSCIFIVVCYSFSISKMTQKVMGESSWNLCELLRLWTRPNRRWLNVESYLGLFLDILSYLGL